MTLTPEQLDALERGLESVPIYSESGLGTAVLIEATDYINEYVYDDGEISADYEPTEFERTLMLDMINGLIGQPVVAKTIRDAAHRCDSATIAELIRGYRIGIAAEHASSIAAEANAFARAQWPDRQPTLIDRMAAKGPLGDETGDITVGKRKEAAND